MLRVSSREEGCRAAVRDPAVTDKTKASISQGFIEHACPRTYTFGGSYRNDSDSQGLALCWVAQRLSSPNIVHEDLSRDES